MLRASRPRLLSLLLPSLLLTTTAAAAPSLAQRFEPRWYAAQGQPVVVQAALDRLALRTQAPLPVEQAAYTITFTRFEEEPFVVYAWRAGNDFIIWRAGEPAKAKLAAGILLPTLNSLKP